MTRPFPATLVALILTTAAAATATEPASIRLLTERDGIHHLAYEDIAPLLAEGTTIASERLGLDHRGRSVPVWVEDGGDGRFDAGDSLEFTAHRVGAPDRAFDDHARFNVYWLRLDHPEPRRFRPLANDPAATPTSTPLRRQHLEEDNLMIRLGSREVREHGEVDVWHWAKLTQIDAEPFTTDLHLDDLDRSHAGSVEITLGLHAMSNPRGRDEGVAAHALEVTFGGRTTTVEWDGEGPHVVHLDPLPATELDTSTSPLELRVPMRKLGEDKGDLVDIIMVNWIEATAPSRGLTRPGPTTLTIEGSGARTVLVERPDDTLVIHTDGGRRGSFAALSPPLSLTLEGDERELHAAVGGVERVVAAELDRPSRLKVEDRRADYLMISHRRLMDAVAPLAEFHASRGLEVSVIDVQDVYDEFNHGIVHPEAIRDFLVWAYHHWQEPRPRFVLLVGDASWDIKHQDIDDANYSNWTQRQLLEGPRFVARPHPVYRTTSALPHRNLVPTSIYYSSEGQSASDNHFACVDGDDRRPDLAVGRLPVVEPEEVEAIVAKTIAYLANPEPGPWRRSLLWITNESSGYQRTSDRIAKTTGEAGFSSTKVYPKSSETSNKEHQRRLMTAFDAGQLLVHFVGHGGRHIWRTGPPDLKKNHDLFTLGHVEALEPSRRLPFILSMTCHSAPFDHPNADSIGETFIRLGERAAIGVLAASWRNSPASRFSSQLVQHLTTPGTTVGEAIVTAKRATGIEPLTEMYNLLGDPAVVLALPAGRLELAVSNGSEGLSVTGTCPEALATGRAVVDLVDAAGEVLASREVAVTEAAFSVTLPPPEGGEVASVRAYAWTPETGPDAIGSHLLEGDKTSG